jgi:hypothetical protein
LIAQSREQAEKKAEFYRAAFIAESQAQGEAAKNEVQQRYATEIQQAREAQAYADSKIEQFNREKAHFERLLKSWGVCKYQDIDAASGKKMRMLAQVGTRSDPHVTSVLASVQKKCSYIGPGGDDYRGLVDQTADGTPCLPWPKGWALKYHGSGVCVCVPQRGGDDWLIITKLVFMFHVRAYL